MKQTEAILDMRFIPLKGVVLILILILKQAGFMHNMLFGATGQMMIPTAEMQGNRNLYGKRKLSS